MKILTSAQIGTRLEAAARMTGAQIGTWLERQARRVAPAVAFGYALASTVWSSTSVLAPLWPRLTLHGLAMIGASSAPLQCCL